MKVFRSFSEIDLNESTCVTIGVFDGVHLGHQRLLKRVKAVGRKEGLISLALTFDPHPEAFLSARGGPPLLTDTEEKLALLEGLGLQSVVVAPFGRPLAEMSPQDFTQRILKDKLQAEYIVAGPETTFGKGGKGNSATLKTLGDKLGFLVEIVEDVQIEGDQISSTAIRKAILAGQLEKAGKMLGRPYRISGAVIPGDKRGQELGFPTANLKPPAQKALPPDGVYACVARVGDGALQFDWNLLNDPDSHVAVVYIGQRPTFGGGKRLIEAHICEEVSDLYGQDLSLYFFSMLRKDAAFDSPEALVQQMVQDAHKAFEIVGAYYAPEPPVP